jgi:Aspartyl protease
VGIRIALVFLLCVSLLTVRVWASDDDKLDAPPAGLTPSSAHLADILKAHESAVGHLDAGVPDRSVEDWSFTDTGQSGTEHLERSKTDYDSQITFGSLAESYGQFNGVRWHHDYNGFTSTTYANDDESFFPLRVLDDLADPKNDVTLKGETTGASPAYVIEIKRPLYHHPEWVFVDKSSDLITRVEWVSGKRRIVNVYDDYRLTDGLRQPWHIHDSDGRPQRDDDWHRTSLSRAAPISVARFAPPPSTPGISLGFADTTALPAKMLFRRLVVRVSVQGRGLDFLIDSASANSYIDRDVAADLNLPTFGALTQLDDGTKLAYMTRIDDATVGPLRFQNLVLESTTYKYQFGENIRVVGVLGYDFLAGVVLHINYLDGTAELIPRSHFAGANPIADSYVLPLVMDDGVPMVSMGIGEGVAPHVIFGTAMPFTVIGGPYIDAHPTDFVDLPGVKRRDAFVPFADENSYGATASVWPTRASHMRIGPSDYQQLLVVGTNFPLGSSEDAADAILGVDYLVFYDVYLDYPDQRIIIKPNAYFFEVFHKNN